MARRTGWRRHMNAAAAALLVLAAALHAPMPALAAHCDEPDLVVVSRTSVQPDGGAPRLGTPASNVNAIACAVAGDGDIDTRVVAPGANEIAVRYTQDMTVDSLSGELDGLGFNHTAITLVRHADETTSIGDPTSVTYLYDMEAFVPLPDGSAAHGFVTVVVHLPNRPDAIVVYHTADQQ